MSGVFNRLLAGLAGAALIATPVMGQAAFDRAGWQADLAQMRAAMDQRYANREWLTGEREVDLDALFADIRGRLDRAGDDAVARAVFDRLVRKIGDGHVAIQWPMPPAPTAPRVTQSPAVRDAAFLCRSQGYDASNSAPGTLARLTGYRAIAEGPYPAGIVAIGRTTLGVLRIGLFDPHDSPDLCLAAVAADKIDPVKPCDTACASDLLGHVYDAATALLTTRIVALKAAGADALIVDIGGNRGGSEWVEAVARMLTARPIRSARMRFVRGPHRAGQWRDTAASLRDAAAKAPPGDRTQLLAWAADADAAQRAAETPCATSECQRLGDAGFASGLVNAAPATRFAGKEWGVAVFSAAQYHYRDGEWNGPLLVYADPDSFSAAEQFAAVLQDNRAAVIIGGRTGGAGCGYTGGGDPVTLTHSRATLKLPDCVRLRADGSNEVRGVLPDVPVALRTGDGRAFAAGLVQPVLSDAIARARRLQAAR